MQFQYFWIMHHNATIFYMGTASSNDSNGVAIDPYSCLTPLSNVKNSNMYFFL